MEALLLLLLVIVYFVVVEVLPVVLILLAIGVAIYALYYVFNKFILSEKRASSISKRRNAIQSVRKDLNRRNIDVGVQEDIVDTPLITQRDDINDSKIERNSLPTYGRPANPAVIIDTKNDEDDFHVYVRFRKIVRAIRLIAHEADGLQQVTFVGSLIIKGFETAGGLFVPFFYDYCDNTEYYKECDILKKVVQRICEGLSEDEIIAWIRESFSLSNPSSPHVINNPPQKRSAKVAQDQDYTPSTSAMPDALNSVRRKHRAMQYSNILAADILKSFEEDDADQFLDHVQEYCQEMTAQNGREQLSADAIPVDNRNKLKIHSSDGISTTTDFISVQANSDNPMIQDFLDIANAMTTMRLSHAYPAPTGRRRPPKTHIKSDQELYKELVEDEFGESFKYEKRFHITYKLLAIAAQRLKEGKSKDEILAEIQKYVVVEGEPAPLVRRKEKPSGSLSKEEKRLLTIVQEISYCLGYSYGASTLEDNLQNLFAAYSQHVDGNVSGYIPMLLDGLNMCAEYKVLLEIILLIRRGKRSDSIIKYYKEAFYDYSAVLEYQKNSRLMKVKKVNKALSLDNDTLYLPIDDALKYLRGCFYRNRIDDKYLRREHVSLDTIKEAFPRRFDSQGHLCRNFIITDREKTIFEDYEIIKPNVSFMVYFPIEEITIPDLYSLLCKAARKCLSQ